MLTILTHNIISKKIMKMTLNFLIYEKRIVLSYNFMKINKQTLLNKVKMLIEIPLFR